MLARLPTGFSDPRPIIPDREWLAYLQHCDTLGTGIGLPRVQRTVDLESFERPAHVDGSRLVPLVVGRGHVLRNVSHGKITIHVFDTFTHAPSEVTPRAWITERVKGYVKGWTVPPRVRGFGPDRFRPRNVAPNEPYFPVSSGFLAYPLATETRWNNYQLGRAIDDGTR